ncbi:DEAD/DEAH box helicase [Candidatus Poriferisocius sp.]|uniref:DEAD/DEAH box helicase n=1 Tax=Candidatus Poriferisocius sp. TaxID=3101276 RepID=UPI003B015E3D
MSELYAYQQQLRDDLDRAWARGCRHPLVQLPTGGGKTVFSADVIRATVKANRRVGVLMHRNELVDQWARALSSAGIGRRDIGALVAGRVVLSALPAHLISVQTLARRLDDPGIDEPDLLITDEAHHSAARQYQQIYRMWPNATRMGLTATPARLDGLGLSPTYDTLIEGPTVAALIRWAAENRHGGLADYKILTIPVMSRDLPRALGDFRRSATEKASAKPRVMARVASVWREHARNRRTLVFAVSRRHGRLLTASLVQAGARAEFLDGTAHPIERRNCLDRFRTHAINVLVTVDLLFEGFDVPEADCAIMARPTESVVVWLQSCGRVLRRKADDRDALILDCVGNTESLGGPASPRTWSLAGGIRKVDRVPSDGKTFLGDGRTPPKEIEMELQDVGHGKAEEKWRETVGQVRASLHNLRHVSPGVRRVLERIRGI